MGESSYLSSRLADADGPEHSVRIRGELMHNLDADLPQDRDSAILEIGPGAGHFLDLLRSNGYTRVRAIDVDTACVAALAARHRVEHVRDSARFLDENQAAFDLIVMLNVISHLDRDPLLRLLVSARSALAPHGKILVQTFNAAAPSAFYTFANDFTHRVPFTEFSLRQILRMAGFIDIQVRGTQLPSGGAIRLLYRLARGIQTLRTSLQWTLERGRGGNPTTFAKLLIAVARRP